MPLATLAIGHYYFAITLCSLFSLLAYHWCWIYIADTFIQYYHYHWIFHITSPLFIHYYHAFRYFHHFIMPRHFHYFSHYDYTLLHSYCHYHIFFIMRFYYAMPPLYYYWLIRHIIITPCITLSPLITYAITIITVTCHYWCHFTPLLITHYVIILLAITPYYYANFDWYYFAFITSLYWYYSLIRRLPLRHCWYFHIFDCYDTYTLIYYYAITCHCTHTLRFCWFSLSSLLSSHYIVIGPLIHRLLLMSFSAFFQSYCRLVDWYCRHWFFALADIIIRFYWYHCFLPLFLFFFIFTFSSVIDTWYWLRRHYIYITLDTYWYITLHTLLLAFAYYWPLLSLIAGHAIGHIFISDAALIAIGFIIDYYHWYWSVIVSLAFIANMASFTAITDDASLLLLIIIR